MIYPLRDPYVFVPAISAGALAEQDRRMRERCVAQQTKVNVFPVASMCTRLLVGLAVVEQREALLPRRLHLLIRPHHLCKAARGR